MKRDSDHFVRILEVVERVWKDNPGLRVSQLLVNAVLNAGREADIFHVEDDDLVKYLYQYNEKYGETKLKEK